MAAPVYFNGALATVMKALSGLRLDVAPIVIRDQYGRIRIAVNGDASVVRELEAKTATLWPALGSYAGVDGKQILGREDFYDPVLVLGSPDVVDYVLPGSDTAVRLLDRQVTGQDWIRTSVRAERGPRRIVFYGLKGGVGRSTALALYAYHLGQTGKRVLLIDFDLESPGLSSIVLPQDRLPEFGIVDWFVEDAVGQSGMLAERMLATSRLSEMPGVGGRIRVAPAMQMAESAYLSKSSRTSVDVPKADGSGVERFHERFARILRELEAESTPDVVLIDSRAGLHDSAAVSIVGFGDTVLVFGTDSPQTWEGLRLLFTHWQSRPSTLRAVRDRLKMVYSMFPESDQDRRAKGFLERSYDLFSTTLYDEVRAGASGVDAEAFNFDLNTIDAPHYPVRINWSPRFLEFCEQNVIDGTIDAATIEASYGTFFRSIDELWADYKV